MNYILKNENSIYYECGYSNDNSIFLSIENESYLFTDGRYSIEAKELTSNIEVIISINILFDVKKVIKKSKRYFLTQKSGAFLSLIKYLILHNLNQKLIFHIKRELLKII